LERLHKQLNFEHIDDISAGFLSSMPPLAVDLFVPSTSFGAGSISARGVPEAKIISTSPAGSLA
jgi:hypothetical protein